MKNAKQEIVIVRWTYTDRESTSIIWKDSNVEKLMKDGYKVTQLNHTVTQYMDKTTPSKEMALVISVLMEKS